MNRIRPTLLAITIGCGFLLSTAVAPSVFAAEITKAQAIARVRAILRSNTSGCSIRKTNSVTAVKVAAGWRVTARIVLAASGRPINERAVWIVSRSQGATAQDQLTAEIGMGCP